MPNKTKPVNLILAQNVNRAWLPGWFEFGQSIIIFIDVFLMRVFNENRRYFFSEETH